MSSVILARCARVRISSRSSCPAHIEQDAARKVYEKSRFRSGLWLSGCVTCSVPSTGGVIFSGGAAQSDETILNPLYSQAVGLVQLSGATRSSAPNPEQRLLITLSSFMAENNPCSYPCTHLELLQNCWAFLKAVLRAAIACGSTCWYSSEQAQLLVSCVPPMPEFSIESESLPGWARVCEAEAIQVANRHSVCPSVSQQGGV